MKKNFKLLLLAFVLVQMTGCYRYKTTMAINKDKSMDMNYKIAIDTTSMTNYKQKLGKEATPSDEVTNTATTSDEVKTPSSTVTNTTTNNIATSSDEIKKPVATTSDEVAKKEDDNDTLTTETSTTTTNFEEAKEEYEKKGYTVKEYKDGGYEGLELTKKFESIDDLSKENLGKVTMLGEENNGVIDKNDYIFSVKKSFLVDTYTANLDYTFNTETSGVSADYTKLFDITFDLTLPSKNLSNNATKVSDDGKTLNWTLSSSNSSVEFSFKMINTTNLIIFCSVTLLIVIILIVMIIMISKKEKKQQSIEKINSEAKVEKVEEVVPVETEEVKPVKTEDITFDMNEENKKEM